MKTMHYPNTIRSHMVTINNMYVEKQAKGIRKIVPITSVRGTGKDIKTSRSA